MKELIDVPALYAQYYWWKSFYKIGSTDSHSIAKYQCKVCEKLNSETTENSSYEDLEEWWNHKARCKKVHIRSHS